MPHISTKDNQGTQTMTTWANKMGWTKGKKMVPQKETKHWNSIETQSIPANYARHPGQHFNHDSYKQEVKTSQHRVTKNSNKSFFFPPF